MKEETKIVWYSLLIGVVCTEWRVGYFWHWIITTLIEVGCRDDRYENVREQGAACSIPTSLLSP